MPMRLSHLLVLLAAGCMAAELPLAVRVPSIKGEYLTGRKAQLPQDASGRVALLALGFTYDSRLAVEPWVSRFRADFGQNPQTTYYEIPMIGGVAQIARWYMDSSLRRTTPKEDQEHIITVYGDAKVWKRRVGYKSIDAAYLILMDKSGVVRWQHSGLLDEAAYKSLAAEVRPLLSANK